MNSYEDKFSNPFMYPVYSIICWGYHLTDQSGWVNKNDIPEMVEMRSTTSDVAEKEGWTTTKNKKFSPTGDIVWLCPDCSKRWKEERQLKINDIIESKQKFYNDYMDQKTTDEHRVWIIDKVLPDLRYRFIDLEPTNDDWQRWHDLGGKF